MRTITAKLTRIYLIVAVSVLFCAGSISQLYLYHHARLITHSNLKTQTIAMAGNLESAVAFGDVAFAEQTLNALQHYPDVRMAAVILSDGKYFAKYGTDTGSDSGSSQQFLAQDEFITAKIHGVVENIAVPGASPARLIVVASLEELNHEMVLTVAASIAIGGLILFSAFTLFRRMSRSVTQPIEDLTAVMRTVERDGDHGQRARIASDDEVGELARGFNAMLSSLETKNARMNAELEERKQIEAEIKATKNQLQATLEAIPDLMFEVGLDGRYYAYHCPRTDLLAAPPEIVLASTVTDVLPADAADVCMSALREANETGHSSGKEFAVPLPQGVRWFEISVSRKSIVAGQEPRFIVLSRDITERKSAEVAQLESELRFRAIIEATPVALALNDDQGKITYLNRAFVETIGYTIEDIPNIADWWPRAYPDPEYQQWITEKWQAASEEARQTGCAFVPLEAIIRCKDGSDRSFMSSATPLTESVAGNHLVVLYDITERKAAEEAIKNLAFYDPLTTLPNRRLLLERVKQARASSARSQRYGALLFIDLDNFKTLNDTRGHDVGDLLLRQVAHRLTGCVREGDTVARLGGDEFVVMLQDLSGDCREAAIQAETVGEKILAALNQTYQFDDYEYVNTPSIGVTLYTDRNGTIDELLRRADLAMYQAKTAGRNTMRFFDPEMQAAVTARVAFEADLREALIKKQFLLHYQPQMDDNGHVTGSEALLRWKHPGRGMVSPADFIPLAEETRLILPLGHWVLETACNQLALWAARPEMTDLTVAVNVSAHQFHQAGFVEEVLTVLRDTGANPQRLKLELTESLLVSNVEEVIEKMLALRAEGVGFSLDDFGTGYSSLSYLKRLPLDQLKIDQSFVRDVLADSNDASIAKTIIALSQNLGLGVIAEGVETEAQRDFLASSGCHAYQGYYFSRPLPLAEFQQFVMGLQRDDGSAGVGVDGGSASSVAPR
jgi:diguanylate cyclase (GGDEF)-like protein/PAS domain S-box-containing protein